MTNQTALYDRLSPFEMVKYFLNNREYYRKNVNIQNDLGETPLHSATSSFIMGNPFF